MTLVSSCQKSKKIQVLIFCKRDKHVTCQNSPLMSTEEDDHVFDFVGSDDEEIAPQHQQYDNIEEEQSDSEDKDEDEDINIQHAIENFINDNHTWKRKQLPQVLKNLGYVHEKPQSMNIDVPAIPPEGPTETFVDLNVPKHSWTVVHTMHHFMKPIWQLMLDDSKEYIEKNEVKLQNRNKELFSLDKQLLLDFWTLYDAMEII